MVNHQKQKLHELLEEDQEPFRLKNYIAERRSQLRKPSTDLQRRKCNPIVRETSAKCVNLCKHACFMSFHNSPDVRKSPFRDFQSPVSGDCKSPNGAVLLHVPSRTAAILMEAAMRIQKLQQRSKSKEEKTVGLGLFGSLVKRLKDRNNNKSRSIGNNDSQIPAEIGGKLEDAIWISHSDCINRRISNGDQIEINNEASSSTSSFRFKDYYGLPERRFSFHYSASSCGSRTPEFSSPADSPCRHVQKEKENYNIIGDENDKEQSSPVSILDSPFHEDDEGGGYDLNCIHANKQRPKEQLSYRLGILEKVAESNPMTLERKLQDDSDDDELIGNNEPPSSSSQYLNPTVDTFVSEVLNKSTMRYRWTNMSSDMKKLVCDLIIEENTDTTSFGSKETVVSKVCSRLDSWKDVEFNTIDMMIGFDFKKKCDADWRNFSKQVEETVEEIEISVFEVIVNELF